MLILHVVLLCTAQTKATGKAFFKAESE